MDKIDILLASDSEAVGQSAEDDVTQMIQCTSKGKKLTSAAWDDMIRTQLDDGSVKAQCKHCKKIFHAPSKNGTTQLNRHILPCPARRYKNHKSFVISSGASNSNATSNEISLRKPIVSLQDIREALTIFIVAGGHAFSIVEEPGFKYLMRATAPDFDLVSRITIKRDAMANYEEEKKIVSELLQNAPGRISFTTD